MLNPATAAACLSGSGAVITGRRKPALGDAGLSSAGVQAIGPVGFSRKNGSPIL